MLQFRIKWRKKLCNIERSTVWYNNEDQADRMSESLRRDGALVMRKEVREINLVVNHV